VKLKSNLALTAKLAQRCAQPVQTATLLRETPAFIATTGCPARKKWSFDLLATRTRKPVRIAPPVINARPVFRGNKSYLQALRAAEMAAWQASIKLPTF
jgi:hypothetical protein